MSEVTQSHESLIHMCATTQFGLPSEGVLFCSFGEAYKLDAQMLRTWTRILDRTPNSHLWLPRYNALAEENLRVHLRFLSMCVYVCVFLCVYVCGAHFRSHTRLYSLVAAI